MPFETVIVIRSSNKLDLLTAPAAKRGGDMAACTADAAEHKKQISVCRMKISAVLFQRNVQCRQKLKPLYLV